MLQLVFWLVASHALCDFALQPTVMARGKSRRHVGVHPDDRRHEPTWVEWLLAHSMIHGAGVAGALALVGRADLWWLGLGETALHALIDFLKADRRITMAADQLLHLACKGLWLFAALALPAAA
jgi:hypothetical protein